MPFSIIQIFNKAFKRPILCHLMANGDKLKDFRERIKALEPDKEAVKAQHAKGKLSAQERIDLLLDKGSFVELDAFAELESTNYDLPYKKKPRDGVLTGYGTI